MLTKLTNILIHLSVTDDAHNVTPHSFLMHTDLSLVKLAELSKPHHDPDFLREDVNV